MLPYFYAFMLKGNSKILYSAKKKYIYAKSCFCQAGELITHQEHSGGIQWITNTKLTGIWKWIVEFQKKEKKKNFCIF